MAKEYDSHCARLARRYMPGCPKEQIIALADELEELCEDFINRDCVECNGSGLITRATECAACMGSGKLVATVHCEIVADEIRRIADRTLAGA